MTKEAAIRYRTDLALVSHLFDAHSMGIADLTEENIHDIIATLKGTAAELEQLIRYAGASESEGGSHD